LIGKTQSQSVRVIAHYFPQFHAIPENDRWWGEGFTDWHNVKKATALFPAHYQPRIPLDANYYDQSQPSTLRWQVDLAKHYGIAGFCHYHYWFDGKQMLNTPTDLMLADRAIDLPFCLAWANETWSRRWEGRGHQVLIRQTHVADQAKWLVHFHYLMKAWSDPRAIAIDGKPIFLIYRPHLINQVDQMLDYWRELAQQHGLRGIYFIAMKQYEFPIQSIIKHFDAVVQFQPFEALGSPDFSGQKRAEQSRWLQPLRKLPEPILNRLRELRSRIRPKLSFYDYDEVWQQILAVERIEGVACFPGAFVDWDNTARYGDRGRVFKGASPERFAYWFKQLVEITAKRPHPENMIFINAWNEWAEGTYLEPDNRHGHKYLEAVRNALLPA
jgi:Glycosyltransferase WbsX